MVRPSLRQSLPHGTFLAQLAGPQGLLPPKCEIKGLGQTSDPVQNFSQICSAVTEDTCPEQTDRKANLISPH